MSLRLAGAAILVIAALFTYVGSQYTASFGDVLGPGAFPLVVGIPAMLLAASIVVVPGETVSWPAPARMARQAAVVAVLLAYAWLLKPLGFPLATFGLIAGVGITLGGPVGKCVLLGALFAPALWALFDRVLGLPLAPLGTWFG